MNAKKHFEKYYSKLRFEAVLKSILCGLVIGFAANFVAAFSTWFTEFNGVWLSLGILAVATAVAAPIFYFKKFRPTAAGNAARIDRLGLEERIITMIEYENDSSCIAELQRADAKAKLSSVEAAQIKFSVSKKILIAVAICAVLGGAMTTVTGLSSSGIIPGADEIINNIIPEEPDVYIAVSYTVDGGGYIEGDMDQLVLLGGQAEQIEAIADDGYAFKGWDDGYRKPYRSDKAAEDIVYTAIFEPIGDGDGQDGQPGDRPGDGDQAGDQPGENGKPGLNGKPGPNGAPSTEGDPNDSDYGGGKYEEYNQIIDGETYYREVLDMYKELLTERLEQEGESLTPEEKAIIESYIGIV